MAQGQALELIDRLRITRRGRRYVAATTLAALLLGLVLVLPIEPDYRTTAIVGSDPSAQNANDRVDFVADVRAAILQPSVIDSVSAELEVPRGQLRTGLAINRLGDSNLIRVIFDSPSSDAETASQVVTLAPTMALEFLKRGAVDSAQAVVDDLQEELDGLQTTLNDQNRSVAEAEAANGGVPPSITVASLRDQLVALNTIVLTGSPDDPQVLLAQASVENLEGQLAPALQLAAEYNTLVSARDDSLSRRRSAESALAAAVEDLRDLSTVPSITVQSVAVRRSPLRSAVVQLLTLMVVAFVGSLFVVSALERRRSPRVRMTVPASSDPVGDDAELDSGAEAAASSSPTAPKKAAAKRAPAKKAASKRAPAKKSAASRTSTPGSMPAPPDDGATVDEDAVAAADGAGDPSSADATPTTAPASGSSPSGIPAPGPPAPGGSTAIEPLPPARRAVVGEPFRERVGDGSTPVPDSDRHAGARQGVRSEHRSDNGSSADIVRRREEGR